MTKEMTPLKYGVLIGLFFLLLVFCIPERSFAMDMEFWEWWSAEIILHGLSEIYNHGSNYPPLIHYFFWAFVQINDTLPELSENVRFIKAIPLAFDFIGALSIFLLMKKDNRNWLVPLFLLFNVAYMYNSYCWGQMDSIHTALTLLSFIFALREKVALALVFFVLALNMKIQAIIFLPLLGLILIPALLKMRSKMLLYLVPAIIVQILLLLPFILAGHTLQVWQVATGTVDYYTIISMNAFNFWHLFLSKSQAWGEDTQLWAGLAYKSWGLLMFCIASTICLMPLLLITINSIRRKDFNTDAYRKTFFLSAGLIALVFFYFNTQMHERYSHPAMILLFIYGWYARSYWLYAIVSYAYVINLDHVSRFFDFPNYGIFFFHHHLIAVLFGLVILWGVYLLYRDVKVKNELITAIRSLRGIAGLNNKLIPSHQYGQQ